jgi:type VI secretion system protein ImpB
MAESTQKKLSRVRAPRVHISYDVEVGGAIEVREIPFVMGVLGDFTGNPREPLEKLKDRKFVEISGDNFDKVLASMKPHLSYSVENTLAGDGSKIAVDLDFRSMDDFTPERVAQQVGPLRQLLELRTQLADLRGSLQGNDKLEEILQQTLGDSAKLDQLRGELGLDGEGGSNG